MGVMKVSFTHRLLNTHITALSVKENLVFIGEGQHLHVHDVASGVQVGSTQVFRGAVVHGLRVQSSMVNDGDSSSWLLLVFGQKSLAVVLFHGVKRKFFVLIEERSVEDWIVDAGLEKDLSHIVVATAHNSLLRCQIPHLVERCRNLSEQISDNDSSILRPGQGQPHNSLHEMQGTQGTQASRSVRSAGTGDMSIVSRAACAERCVLFCGHLVMMSGTWEGSVMMAGTMALQVMIWGPWGARNSEGHVLPQHCLLGHLGSIFSITFCSSQHLIATTSDDRSLRVWEVKHKHETETEGEGETDIRPNTNYEQDQEYWRSAVITEKFASYGHRARVWQSLILPSWVISVGEDSVLCVWEHSGVLAASWKAHDGASIWSVAACKDPINRLITGGNDGSVKSWCLSTVAPVSAEVMSGLPWGDLVPVISDEHPVERCGREMLDSAANSNVNFSTGEVVECDVPESHELFENSVVGISPLLRKEPSSTSSAAAASPDFPRCISLLGERMVLVVTNNGRLYSHNPKTSWHLEYEDERLKNYAIMEASPDSRRVAIGTLSGTVVILQVAEEGSVLAEVEAVGSPGKVFALQWLTMDRILVLGTAGVMTTWELLNKGEGASSPVSTHHLPVSMHRWLCAVYVPVYVPSIHTPASPPPLVLSTHTPASPPPLVPSTHTPASPHQHHLVCGDRAGSLHLYNLDAPTAQDTLQGIHGRNGVTSLLYWQGGVVYSSGRDGCVRSVRLCDGRLLPLTVTRVSGANWVSRLIIVRRKLLAVCFQGVKLKVCSVGEEQTLLEVECGGAHRSWDLRVCGARGQLVCAFLKDGLPYTFSTSLHNKLMPLIRPALNTQETMDVRVLYHHNGKAVLVTGGEDTTLRLHSLPHQGQRQGMSVLRSHLSGVRTLCLVEGNNATKSDNGSVWLVSAGGRAEFKVWHCSVNGFSDLDVNSTCDFCSYESCPLSSRLESDPSSSQPQSVALREVVSHMLRSGGHRTWKSQHLTLDPETRYMSATAFWVSSALALVALASSDGFLRMFLLMSECEKVREACAVECGSCVLKVTQLKVPGGGGGTILVTCSTKGHITFWDMQPVVDWSLQLTASENLSQTSQQSPQPLELTRVAAHQSGVNAIAFCYNTDDPTSNITMATGGDDNKLSVWKIVVVEGGEVEVSHLCSLFGHASQISGLGWLSRNYLISASIDQRLIVWNLCDKKYEALLQNDPTSLSKATGEDEGLEEHQRLTPVGSCFTGVPDVKGIVIMDESNSENVGEKSHMVDKRVLVFGMGLQVFDISFESL